MIGRLGRKALAATHGQGSLAALSLFDSTTLNGDSGSHCRAEIDRVTHQVESNLPLTSKQKFRFGLSWSGQARPKQNFCFDVNGKFGST